VTRNLRLLCVCWEFPPQTTPTAIRTGKVLSHLARDGWELNILTATIEAALPASQDVSILYVPQPPSRLLSQWLIRHRLGKLVDYFDWVDDKHSWVHPAIKAAFSTVAEKRPDAILVFMMPYAAGLVGIQLKRLTGLPIVVNFDDSPTCGDMHPTFASRWHFRRAEKFEDDVVQSADAVIYVSQRNLDRVRDRQPLMHREKFHLIRYGADPADFTTGACADSRNEGDFRIVYIGGMTGWHAFGTSGKSWLFRLAKRLLTAWNRLGRYTIAELDHRGSSPVFVAKAAQQVMRDNPKMTCRIKIEIYGSRPDQATVDGLLKTQQITDVVTVHGPVPNAAAIKLAREADLLFLALPDRLDGCLGGRISAKTYEYMMTDRPILAAVPPGENAEFLGSIPGVTIVRPTDSLGMARAIIAAIQNNERVRRSVSDISYDKRARTIAKIIRGLAT
jgi:hypothetical protein